MLNQMQLYMDVRLNKIKELQKQGLGQTTPNTLDYYYSLYLKYLYYYEQTGSKMQSYCNVSMDCGVSEVTVQRAVKVWEQNIG